MQTVCGQLTTKGVGATPYKLGIQVYIGNALVIAIGRQKAVDLAHGTRLAFKQLPLAKRLIDRQQALNVELCRWRLSPYCRNDLLTALATCEAVKPWLMSFIPTMRNIARGLPGKIWLNLWYMPVASSPAMPRLTTTGEWSSFPQSPPNSVRLLPSITMSQLSTGGILANCATRSV